VATDPLALVDHLFRRQAGQMVATLTRTLGSRHLALAEDAVQDALLTAMQQWPFRGIPDHPEAWLFQVARNRALDRLRHGRMAADKEPAIALEVPTLEEPAAAPLLRNELPPLEDDQLGLLFLTCHPSLSADARVALALKLVGGFSVGEIARAFLSQESAIAQRLVRAKRQLRDANASFGMPDPTELPARVDSVLDALYLMFNEGYAATSGDQLIRDDVAAEDHDPSGRDRAARLGAVGADAAACRPLSRAGRFRRNPVPAARSGSPDVGSRHDRRGDARARSRVGG
jgi:RNA polymerase sigma-70 factor (ECF subfamily)